MKFPKKIGRRAEIDLFSPDQFSPGISIMTRLYAFFATCTVLAAAWTLQGCDKNPLGTVDTNGNAPSLTAPLLSPAAINIDSLAPNSYGIYTFSVTMQAKVIDADGDLESVGVSVLRPGDTAPYYELNLLDNGVAPDAAAGDGIYSAPFQFEIYRSDAGTYRFQFFAVDKSGLTGNSVDLPFVVRRRNAAPTVGEPVAPDTVVLPVGGSVLVKLSIAASDSDGLADISQVYFKSLTSSSPDFKFFMKDDGGLDPPGAPFGIASGDSLAGDGVFTITVPLVDGQAQRRTNLFAYQAIDRSGDTSTTVYKYLTVK
jgi:hypothetical protein